ncbi:MAG: EndoU domain-containing protein, partial [Rhizonema sp. PD38]|nr:EndoU domain-containing protein [Rhizonema sp. PD38]
ISMYLSFAVTFGNPVNGYIYTMGIMIKQGDKIVSDRIKGYSYLTNAEDILLDATKIFKLQGDHQGDCIYNVRDWKTGKSFPSVFVRKEKAIITFYPDATPHGQQCRS